MVHTWSPRDTWWSKGHASLIDDGRGGWYVVYHAYENGHRNLGRHTLIEPVEWTADGWFKPLYSRDRVPAAAVVREPPGSRRTISTQPSLGLQWQFSGIASMEEYSVGNGAVTVTAEPGKFKVLNSEAADHNYEASVRVDPAPGAESRADPFLQPADLRRHRGRAGMGGEFAERQSHGRAHSVPRLPLPEAAPGRR